MPGPCLISRLVTIKKLQLVQIVIQVWDARLQTLPCLAVLHNLVWLAALLHWVSGQDLPVVEHALREGLATGVGSQISCEAKGLVDRQVGLDHEHGCAGCLGLPNTCPLLPFKTP